MIQKATLEHQIAKACSQLGSKIYDKAVRKAETFSLEDKELKTVVDEIQKLEQQHNDVELVLEKERNKLKSSKPRASKKSRA